MVYNLSFINYAGRRVFDEIEELKELEEETRVNLYNVSARLDQINQTKEIQRMTADLKEEIKAANKSQTEEMQQMTKDLKEEIKAANSNQTEEMQQMTADLKEEIKAANKSQTQEMQRMTWSLKQEIKAVNENQTEEMTEGFNNKIDWLSRRAQGGRLKRGV